MSRLLHTKRVVLIQAFVPKYEVPLFDRLAEIPGIELIVLADLRSSSQLNQYDASAVRFGAQHLPRRPLGPFFLRPGLFRRLRELNPGAVIINGDPRELSQLFAAVWARIRRVPVGVWSMFHRIGKRRLFTEIYMRVIGAVGDVQLSYGQKGRSEQIRRGISADKIVVLSTAIAERPVMKVRDGVTADMVEHFRRDQGIEGKKVLLHVVRLTAIKKPEVMVECFAALAKQRSDVLLVWIGGGPLEESTRRLAANLGVGDRMRFLGPIYDEDVLALWFKSATVFVMATCIGLSIHHAMCYGVPVVTDDSALTQSSEFEVLQSEVNGLTYRAGDSADFVRQASRVLDDDEFRTFLSANAMRRIECDYTFEKKIRNFADGIRRLTRLAAERNPTDDLQ
jgi:glycosyltransferase involved in cell wall biosynthesis